MTWAVENHDVVRSPTRYGAGAQGRARARAALLTVLALPGSAYLYQGQELGLPRSTSRAAPTGPGLAALRGVPGRRPRAAAVDHRPAGAHGFSSRPDCRPWLPVPGVDWGELSVQAQKDDPGSTLALATAALRLRRSFTALAPSARRTRQRCAPSADGLLVVDRPGTRLVVNMGAAPVALPPGEVLLSSGPLDGEGNLPADTAAWLAVSGR